MDMKQITHKIQEFNVLGRVNKFSFPNLYFLIMKKSRLNSKSYKNFWNRKFERLTLSTVSLVIVNSKSYQDQHLF